VLTLLRSDDENGHDCQQYYCESYQAKHTFLTAEYQAQRAVGADAGPLPSRYDKWHGGSIDERDDRKITRERRNA
jgi:hypothetical protein